MRATMKTLLLMGLMSVLLIGVVLAGHGNGGVPQAERNNMTLHTPQNGTNISSNYFMAANGSATLSTNSSGHFDSRFLLNASTGNHSMNVTWRFENSTGETNFSNRTPMVGQDGGVEGNTTWRFQLDPSTLNDGLYNVSLITFNQSLAETVNNNTGLGNITQVRVDRTAPNITYNLSTPGNNSIIRGTRFLNFTAEDVTTIVRNITVYINNGTDDFIANYCSWMSAGKANCTFTWVTNGDNQSVNKNISYLFRAVANDSLGNERLIGAFNVTIDNKAPTLTSEAATGITSSGATLEVKTDENTNCRFASSADAFSQMTAMTTTGGATHTHALTGLAEGTKYARYIRCQDSAEDDTGEKNEGNLVLIEFTTTTSGGGSASGASGTSGATGGGAVSSVAGQFAKGTWKTLAADLEASVSVAKSEEVGVGKVSFVLDKPGKGIVVEIKKSKKESLPAGTPDLKDTYKVIEIKATNINAEDLGAAEIEFTVTKAWLEQNKLAKADVALFRLVDGKWVKLGGEVVKEDAKGIHYKVKTPGFSYFAIAPSGSGEGAAEAPKTEPAAPAESKPAAPAPTSAEQPKTEAAPAAPAAQPAATGRGRTALWVVVALVVVGVVAYLVMRSKKGKN